MNPSAKSRSSASVGRNSDKFIVRLPSGMRDDLAKIAKTTFRSLNAEIVFRLSQSLSEWSSPRLDPFACGERTARSLIAAATASSSSSEPAKNTGILLRLPSGMRDAVKAAAGRNLQSMNAEIISRLSESLYRSPERPVFLHPGDAA